MFTQSTLKAIRAVHKLMKDVEQCILYRLDNGITLRLEIPNEPYPTFLTLSRDSADRMSLLVFRGPDAEEHNDRHLDVTSPEDTVDFDVLTMIFCRFDELDSYQREVVQALRIPVRRETLVPIIGAKKKGAEPRPAKGPDLLVAQYALSAILEANDDDWIEEALDMDPPGRLNGIISGPIDEMQIEFDIEVPEETSEPTAEQIERVARETAALLTRSIDVDPEKAELFDWIAAMQRTIVSMVPMMDAVENANEDAMAQYFGDFDDGDRLTSSEGGDLIVECYSNWRCRHFRVFDESSSTSKTHLEIYAERQLAPIDRSFVEAWLRAVPSFHRVLDVHPDGAMSFVDEVTGEESQIVDRSLAAVSEKDDIVVGAMIHLGRHTLLRIYAQAFALDIRADAENYLRSIGFDFSRDAFEKVPHFLGRLWRFFDDDEKKYDEFADLPELNQLYVARFSMRHPQFVRSAIAARSDIVETDDENVFHWVEEITEDPDDVDDGQLIYAMIRIDGNELIVECGAEEDCDAAIEWIEKLPGKVKFETRTIEDDITEEDAQEMMDRFEKMDLPADLRAETEKQLREMMEGWLDENNPAFGGKTPRQHARTPAGRIEVREHILSMQSLRGPSGIVIEPPKKLFLNELGLD